MHRNLPLNTLESTLTGAKKNSRMQSIPFDPPTILLQIPACEYADGIADFDPRYAKQINNLFVLQGIPVSKQPATRFEQKL